MDLGVFCPVVNNHNVASENLKTFEPDWELNRDFVLLAEEAGFKFALSQVTLAGWGGKTQHWDKSLESFTLMSALAAATSKIRLYASVAVLTIPPPIIARMAMTIDDISDGRFGVNIVSGYNKKQYAQMDVWPGDEFFQTRYDYSDRVRADPQGALVHRREQLQGQVLPDGPLQARPAAGARHRDRVRRRVRPRPGLHRPVRRLQLPDAARRRRGRAQGQ